MSDAQLNQALRRADRAWRNEGWVPSLSIFVLTILAIGLLGSRITVPADAITELRSAEAVGETALAVLRQLFDALANAGLFFAPGAPWIVESLIALIVAAVAIPALRDLSARPASDESELIEALARRVLALQNDADAIGLRAELPGLALDQALRKFAGVFSQAVAVLAAVMWTTTIAATTRVWLGWEAADPVLEQATGVLFVAPFVVAIASVTSLYRITPDRIRLRRLVAVLLDERATRARASAFTPTYSGRAAARLLWSSRVVGVLLLTLAWIAGLAVPPLATGSSWDVVFGSPLAGVFIQALLLVAVVWALFDGVASGLVSARFWIGGRVGTLCIIICGLLLAVLIISFAVLVIAPASADGDWWSSALFTTFLVVPTISMGLPVVVRWRRALRFVPGYAQLLAIERARDRLIKTYSDEITLRLAPISPLKKRMWWVKRPNRPGHPD